MAEVEHHPDVIALAFAGHPHCVAEGVDVKACMGIENDAQAGLFGLVGNFPDKGHRLLVGVVLLAPLDEQLENGIPSLEILDGFVTAAYQFQTVLRRTFSSHYRKHIILYYYI